MAGRLLKAYHTKVKKMMMGYSIDASISIQIKNAIHVKKIQCHPLPRARDDKTCRTHALIENRLSHRFT
jgi:hypothetical protein